MRRPVRPRGAASCAAPHTGRSCRINCSWRAALDDAPAVDHQNLVGVADGRDAVRHDDRGARAHDPPQAQQNFLFGVSVDGRQRIVQDQDARIDGDGAGERRALLLATRKRDAALADDRFVAVGKVGDILVEPGRRGGIRDAPRAHVIVAAQRFSHWLASRLSRLSRAVPPFPPLLPPHARPGRTRRCRQSCPRKETAPAPQSRWRRGAPTAGCRARPRRRGTPCRAAARTAWPTG